MAGRLHRPPYDNETPVRQPGPASFCVGFHRVELLIRYDRHGGGFSPFPPPWLRRRSSHLLGWRLFVPGFASGGDSPLVNYDSVRQRWRRSSPHTRHDNETPAQSTGRRLFARGGRGLLCAPLCCYARLFLFQYCEVASPTVSLGEVDLYVTVPSAFRLDKVIVPSVWCELIQ